MEKKVTQPSRMSIKEAVLLFPGPIVTRRMFQQCASRMVRGICKQELEDVLRELESNGCGKVVKAHITIVRTQVFF